MIKNSNMTLTEFIKQSDIPSELIRAVVRKAGGWDSFKEMAKDVNNHGADGGFHGFTYYEDTCRFYAINRDSILEYARSMAEDFGMDLMAFVASFRVLKDSTESEIGLTLYGTKKQYDTTVANALSWFALEEVSRSYVDILEG